MKRSTRELQFETDGYVYKVYNAAPVGNSRADKKLNRKKNKNSEPVSEVSLLFDDIDKNSKDINSLLVDKYNIIGKIHAIMNLRAYSKTRLTDAQILQYVDFNKVYGEELNAVNENLGKIESINLESAKLELLKPDADIDSLVNELREISSSQTTAISSLTNIIDVGSKTLSVL